MFYGIEDLTNYPPEPRGVLVGSGVFVGGGEMTVGVRVGVRVGVLLGVGEGVLVGVSVLVGVRLGVSVIVGEGVREGVRVIVGVGVREGVSVIVGVRVMVGVRVGVNVSVGVAVKLLMVDVTVQSPQLGKLNFRLTVQSPAQVESFVSASQVACEPFPLSGRLGTVELVFCGEVVMPAPEVPAGL